MAQNTEYGQNKYEEVKVYTCSIAYIVLYISLCVLLVCCLLFDLFVLLWSDIFFDLLLFIKHYMRSEICKKIFLFFVVLFGIYRTEEKDEKKNFCLFGDWFVCCLYCFWEYLFCFVFSFFISFDAFFSVSFGWFQCIFCHFLAVYPWSFIMNDI